MNFPLRFISSAVLLLSFCVACDESGPTDAGSDDPRDADVDASAAIRPPAFYETASCRVLYDDFVRAMAPLDRSCDADTECTTLGGQTSNQFCDGYPALGSHAGGTTASTAAYQAAATKPSIDRMIEEWNERCAGQKSICGSSSDDVPCVWDAAQFPTKCVDHVCTEQGDSCI